MHSEVQKDAPDAPKSEQKVEPIRKAESSVQKVLEPAVQKQDPSPPTNNSSVGFNSDLMNLIITENRLQNTGIPRKLWILLHSGLCLCTICMVYPPIRKSQKHFFLKLHGPKNERNI